jgi:hypothetical protein
LRRWTDWFVPDFSECIVSQRGASQRAQISKRRIHERRRERPEMLENLAIRHAQERGELALSQTDRSTQLAKLIHRWAHDAMGCDCRKATSGLHDRRSRCVFDIASMQRTWGTSELRLNLLIAKSESSGANSQDRCGPQILHPPELSRPGVQSRAGE